MSLAFNPYMNPQYNNRGNLIKKQLREQRDEIDFMLNNMEQTQQTQQTQTPVNNIINAQQPINDSSMFVMKVLNDNEEVENIFIEANTIFIGIDKMQIKKLDGTIEKYNIKKYYPIDPKDKKIEELTKKIEDMERRFLNNDKSSKPDEPASDGDKSASNDDVVPKSKSNSGRK